MKGKLPIVAILCALALSCLSGASANQHSITLQSTTSTRNSGLLGHILPKFTMQTGVAVRVVAVGTGQALANARRGDGDLLLVHAKRDEEMFVAQGYGIARYDLMYNDFILVGPEQDPARIAGKKDVAGALAQIAGRGSLFVSRGDDSGTHKKERELWQDSGIKPDDDSSRHWYKESGTGMGATLNIAWGMNAYTLVDRASWVSFANKKGFRIIVEGDTRLHNQYGIVLVNPERHPHVKAREAELLAGWLRSERGQAEINAYRINGQQVFFANAGKKGAYK